MVREGAKKVSRRDLAYLAGMVSAALTLCVGHPRSGPCFLRCRLDLGLVRQRQGCPRGNNHRRDHATCPAGRHQGLWDGGLGGVHRGWQGPYGHFGRPHRAWENPGRRHQQRLQRLPGHPATLEYLETHGVLVATFADGREGPVDFPAFWARDSGVKSPLGGRGRETGGGHYPCPGAPGYRIGSTVCQPNTA